MKMTIGWYSFTEQQDSPIVPVSCYRNNPLKVNSFDLSLCIQEGFGMVVFRDDKCQ